MSKKNPEKQCAANFWNSTRMVEITFLQELVMGDETWLHHFEPETKRQSMEWYNANSPYSPDLARMIITFSVNLKETLVNAAKQWLRRAGLDY